MIPVFMAGFTLLLGLTAPLWFGVGIPWVRMLRSGAKWLDPQTVSPPTVQTPTVKELREHQRCGDKIVVAHHLADWSRDLERRIFQTLSYGTAAAFVLVIVLSVNDPSLHADTASFEDLLEKIRSSWPLSILLAYSLLEILVVIRLVHDLAEKYRNVIVAAKPQR